MPQDFLRGGRRETSVTSATTSAGIHSSATAFSQLSMLTLPAAVPAAVPAAAAAAPPPPPPPSIYPTTTGPGAFSTARPTLPPLTRVHQPSTPGTPAAIPPGSLLSHREFGFASSPPSYTPSGPSRILHPSIPLQSAVTGTVHHTQHEHSLSPTSRLHNPLKRGLEQAEAIPERSANYDNLGYASQIDYENRRLRSGTPPPPPLPPPPPPPPPSSSTVSSYPTFGQPSFSSSQQQTSSNSITSRCVLHIRQQPRAARAGPDGKDRRPIDPPPVVQLLMTDFDPSVPADVQELQNSYYVVHCRLVSANSPRRDVSTLASTTEDGSKEVQRLLLGSAVSSPHHTRDDPNPSTMPSHPVSSTGASGTDPPSPTARFITLPSSSATRRREQRQRPAWEVPCTFFIFADLSVRKAGEYRLEFNLMKVEADKLVPGASMPILHTVASQVFKVVNAKDFDQVQPSTRLIRGLIERGAGFPLKLKKGTREGQRRRPPNQDSSNPGAGAGATSTDDHSHDDNTLLLEAESQEGSDLDDEGEEEEE